MESSNYNLKRKASCIQLFHGSGQSLLQVHLVRRHSPDEITSISSNTDVGNAMYSSLLISPVQNNMENQVASNDPAVKTNL